MILSPLILRMLDDELASAINKHGLAMTPLSHTLTDEKCLTVLVEEIGEVARAMTYDEGNETQLLKELIQVGAMSLAWATRVMQQKDMREAAEDEAGGLFRATYALPDKNV